MKSGDQAIPERSPQEKRGLCNMPSLMAAVCLFIGDTPDGQISCTRRVKQDLTPLQSGSAGLGKVVALLCQGVCGAVFSWLVTPG